MGEYSKNYIKIYFWRAISIISGFLSLLIVVPHISNNIELYGIYAFCISFTLYLTYADIGFLSAGQKYAAEEFAKGNREEEIGILGFTGAILLLMILPFSLIMVYFSFNPSLVLSGLSEGGEEIASSIFLILGLLSPFQIIIQRLVQSILIIRIKDYISLRIDVIFNLIKILSVFFFFSEQRYMIVEYYFFITTLTIISSIIVLFIIKKSEDYDFISLLKSIRLSKKYFIITKKLAISSLFLTIGWLVYYELDLIIIGKWFGPNEVAIYAIGFTFLNFLRTLWNTVFSPFAQRFNHFVGTGYLVELKKLTTSIVDYTMPLCIITTVTLIVSAKQIVLFWVGPEYLNSVIILQMLILGTGFGFMTQPASYYFTAKTKYKFIYLLAFALPIVFLLGVGILVTRYGILGFAISKSIAMFVGFIISIVGISSLIKPMQIIGKWLLPSLILSVGMIFVSTHFLSTLFPDEIKSSSQLMILILSLACVVIGGYFIVLITQKTQRKDLKMIANKIYLRFNGR